MKDEPDPPRKYYQFKDKEFERVNKSLADTSSDSDDPNNGPIDVQELYRSANAGPTVKTAQAPTDNEVHVILRENVQREKEAGLHDIAPRPRRKSKRTRDYFITMIGGNLLLIGGLFVVPVFAGAGLVVFNIMLIWIMWVVMDNY